MGQQLKVSLKHRKLEKGHSARATSYLPAVLSVLGEYFFSKYFLYKFSDFMVILTDICYIIFVNHLETVVLSGLKIVEINILSLTSAFSL